MFSKSGIEAENEEHALSQIKDGLGEFIDGTFEYSHTLEPEHWVIKQNK